MNEKILELVSDLCVLVMELAEGSNSDSIEELEQYCKNTYGLIEQFLKEGN